MSKQREFLEDVFLSNAIRDSLGTRKGRRIYESENPSDSERAALGDLLKSELRKLAKCYESRNVDDEAHIKNIRELANRVSESCGKFLKGNRFGFGRAQKALNVYLKYLGCAEPTTFRPPQCPFDNDVISELKKLKKLAPECEHRWTHADDEDSYRKWVEAARAAAKDRGQSLEEWELDVWAAAQTRKAKAAQARKSNVSGQRECQPIS